MTLEVPDMVGQEGATGLKASSSQSSPTSLLPPILMTKLRKYPPPRCQARQVEAGSQKENLVERQGGKERGKGDGTSLPRNVRRQELQRQGGMLWWAKARKRPFKVLREGTAAANIRSRGFHLG